MSSPLITFKNLPATEALKQHLQKRTKKLEKLVPYSVETRAVLWIEKQAHWVELSLHAEHKELVAKAHSHDLYESIDQVVHKLEVQLKKEREKRKGHKTGHLMARPSASKLAHDVDADLPHQRKNTG